MATPDSVEEHWRMIMLERLQKLEASVETIKQKIETTTDTLKSELVEIKTAGAVSAHDAKSQLTNTQRSETEIKELFRMVRDLERNFTETPRGQEAIEKRVKVLEEWQSNLIGRLTILGFFGTALTSLISSLLVRSFGG